MKTTTPSRPLALEPAKMLTLKQVFTRVRDHLLEQNAQSVSEADYTACAYRGRNGLSCAVGCLIGDDYYRPEFEGLAFALLPQEQDYNGDARRRRAGLLQALVASGVPVENRQVTLMLGELQRVHDEVDPAAWPAHLNEVGIKYLAA